MRHDKKEGAPTWGILIGKSRIGDIILRCGKDGRADARLERAGRGNREQLPDDEVGRVDEANEVSGTLKSAASRPSMPI